MRKIILILVGTDLLLYAIISIFHIQTSTAYGDCFDGVCVDKMRTNYWAVALYAGLGLSFIGAVVLTVIYSFIELWQALKKGNANR